MRIKGLTGYIGHIPVASKPFASQHNITFLVEVIAEEKTTSQRVTQARVSYGVR